MYYEEEVVEAIEESFVRYLEKKGASVCRNCKYWYRNLKGRGISLDCPWRNSDVPRAMDFCSRWESKEEKE